MIQTDNFSSRKMKNHMVFLISITGEKLIRDEKMLQNFIHIKLFPMCLTECFLKFSGSY